MDAEKIQYGKDGKLNVPNQPIIPYIEGDGVGPDIWKASVRVFDAAVKKCYGAEKKSSLARSLCRRKGISIERGMGARGDDRERFENTKSASKVL